MLALTFLAILQKRKYLQIIIFFQQNVFGGDDNKTTKYLHFLWNYKK